MQYRSYLQLFSSLFDNALKLKFFCALVAELLPRAYIKGAIRFMDLTFALEINTSFFNCLLRLRVLQVNRWLVPDFLWTNFPVPVFLKRLATERLVFNFGIIPHIY